ncbi:hypothetical protein DSM104635_00188 [Terricaulis silvestris]|uniref:Transglutaminase-like domain protein n=2 Tax=Terricaulis silvestris TaxID=2686094 RepID=A0A6I6MJP5_9CAUL|nr:hypothetical protein DSM104635_00188 [Terricaulis silvestris]
MEMSLTDVRWEELRQVNRTINRSIRPATDLTTYGVEEYWNRPLVASDRGARGDCDDYALEKRARLIALGWTPDMVALAIAMAPRVGLHAVLIVQTNHGDFVLDNLADEPRALSQLRYGWISRQSGSGLITWAAAYRSDVTTQRPRAVQLVDASPEDAFHRMMGERLSARGATAFAPGQTPVSEPAAIAADIARGRR